MSLAATWAREPTVFLLRKLWRFSPGRRHLIVAYTAMFVLANLVVLAPPAIFGVLVREVQAHGLNAASLPRVLGLLGLLFANVLVFWALHGPARFLERSVAFAAEMDYRRHLLGAVLALDLAWHSDHESGDTIDKVNKAGDGIAGFGGNVFQVIQVVVKLLGTTVAVCFFAPWIGALALGMVLLSFYGILQFDRRLVPQYSGLNRFGNQASAKVFDALSNVTTAKILHIERPLLQGVMARYLAPLRLFRANVSLNEWKWFAGAVCFQCVAIVPLALYVARAVAVGEAVDAGTISALYMYLSNLTAVYSGFSAFYQEISIYKQRVLNAADIEAAVEAAAALPRREVQTWRHLAVDDVVFRYAGRGDTSSLRGVALSLRRGERVALMGESGAGKSTFLKVLHGMYPSARGALSVDGAAATPTCFADVDLHTMLVPQEPEVFAASIRENMTLGIECSEAQLRRAASLATFDKVLATLPQGIDSVMGERGVNLSGGQKQRLALTRALLFAARKDIVLLDESTSSVDPHNETEIYRNVWQDFADKTVVACIHKMNLLKLFDRIIIFGGGRIVDEGTFDALLARNAGFQAAWQQFVATQPQGAGERAP